MGRINHLAVVANVVVQQVFGYVWYAVIFAAPWMAGVGKTEEELTANGPMMYGVAIVASFLMSYAMAWTMSATNAAGLNGGLRIGAIFGLALMGPTALVHAGFLAMPPAVIIINGAKEAVGALIAGAILGSWRERAAG